MKIMTIFLMVLSLVLAAAYSDASDEGPTVIIVGPENDRKTTSDDQEPERQIEQTSPEEESPDTMGTENENPNDQNMDEPEQGMESQDTEEPEGD
jgi:hypothetical protein